MNTEYHATKYDSPAHEFLHAIADHWTMEWNGNVDAPTGAYVALNFTTDDLWALRREAELPAGLGLRTILSILDHCVHPGAYAELWGWFILSVDDQGFCYAWPYLDELARDDALAAMDEQYEAWLDDDSADQS